MLSSAAVRWLEVLPELNMSTKTIVWVAGVVLVTSALLIFIFHNRQKPRLNEKEGHQVKEDSGLLKAGPSDLKRRASELFSSYTAGLTKPKWELKPWKDQCEVHLLKNCRKEPAKDDDPSAFHLVHSMQIPPQLSEDKDLMPAKDKRAPAALQTIYYNES